MARLDYPTSAPGIYRTMEALDAYLGDSTLDRSLLYLVQLRASQINGCAYCIDMHWKDLRKLGEPEHRLYALDAWSESPWYTEREAAALAWTEAVTSLGKERVSDEVFRRVREQFEPTELCDLTLAIAAINAWNRLSIAARLDLPGAIPSGSEA